MPAPHETLDPGPPARRSVGLHPRCHPLTHDERLWVGALVLGLLLILAVVLQILRA